MIKKIKTSKFDRTLALANISAKSGAKYASKWLKNKITKSEEPNSFLATQADFIGKEIGKLKGPLMKIGQMVSTFGKGVLPEELIESMKQLQSDSEPLQWQSIEKTIKTQFSPELLSELDIEETPYAAASLGQVHRATIKATGERICLKVQYPGVDTAIATDMMALKKILSAAGFITKEEGFENILLEVKEMLEQETDYEQERATTVEYAEIFAKDPRISIPKVYEKFSTKKILATEYLPGSKIDSEEVLNLSQNRRNNICHAMMDHYLVEFFEICQVQTDPHFGNYAIRVDPTGEKDQLIMYDFGALRKIPADFHKLYVELLHGAFHRDYDKTLQGSFDMGILNPEDKEFIKNLHVLICFTVVEGFMNKEDERVRQEFFDSEGNYDWGKTDLFLRVSAEAQKFAKKGFFRPPPREFIFINRKTLGVFNFLKILSANINCHDKIKKYI